MKNCTLTSVICLNVSSRAEPEHRLAGSWKALQCINIIYRIRNRYAVYTELNLVEYKSISQDKRLHWKSVLFICPPELSLINQWCLALVSVWHAWLFHFTQVFMKMSQKQSVIMSDYGNMKEWGLHYRVHYSVKLIRICTFQSACQLCTKFLRADSLLWAFSRFGFMVISNLPELQVSSKMSWI